MNRPSARRAVVYGVAAAASMAGVVWLLDYLPPSSQTLERRVDDADSVVDVTVLENDGDGLPFPLMRAPQDVEVQMTDDATTGEVSAVLDAYADDVDDGDVLAVTVNLESPRRQLITCCGSRAGEAVIDDFLEAAADPHVRSYRREVLDCCSTVEVEVEPMPFEDLVARLTRYAAVEPVESVTVDAGAFVVIRDEQFGPASVARIDARVRVVSRLVDAVPLAGAVIADRSPLELRLDDAADEPRVRRLLAETADGDIGKVRIVVARPRG